MQLGGQPDAFLLAGLDGPVQEPFAAGGQGGHLTGQALQAGQDQPEQHHRRDGGDQVLGVPPAGQLDHLHGRRQQRGPGEQPEPPAAEADLAMGAGSARVVMVGWRAVAPQHAYQVIQPRSMGLPVW